MKQPKQAGGVSQDRSRPGKQFRARLCHFGGLLDLGRFETENEAKLAYDQAVRALGLAKPLNYPECEQYFSAEVQRKVQAFLGRNTDACGFGAKSPSPSPAEQAFQAVPCVPAVMQLEGACGLGPVGCSMGSTSSEEMLLSGDECVPWDEAVLQECTLGCVPGGSGTLWVEPASPGQEAQQDDPEVMAAVLAEILAEEGEQVAAAATSSAAAAQHEQQPCLHEHQACSAGCGAAWAPAHLPAGPRDSCGQFEPAAAAAHLQQQQQQQQQQQLVAPASSALGASGLPQQQVLLAPLVSCGEVVLFVDVTTKLLLQLYTRLTANNSMPHAGLTAIQWMSDVRACLSAHAFSPPGLPGSSSGAAGGAFGGMLGPPSPLQAAVLHTCSTLVSVAAGGSGGVLPAEVAGGSCPFSSGFLLAVLEQVLQVLMALRSLCAALPPAQGLSSAVLQAWWQGQLQAQAGTEVGQAVAALLGTVLGAAHA